MTQPPDLSETVRRVDEDRWLASRFAPALVRRRLNALYAVNYEIARTNEAVRTVTLGEIRFAWWREALDEIHAGKGARAHPALEAYAHEHAAAPYLCSLWDAIFKARAADLERAPFGSFEALTRYVDATAGALMRLAVAASDPAASAQSTAFITPAARAWGFAGLLRVAPLWAAFGRELLPAGVAAGDLKAAALSALAEARESGGAVAPKVFPAVGYVTLVESYLRDGAMAPMLLERQARLVVATARGRF